MGIPVRQRKNGKVLSVSILVVLCVNVYLEIPLRITQSFYIPGALIIFSIPILLFLHKVNMYKRDLSFLLLLSCILLMSIFFSPVGDLLGHKLFSGFFQIIMSIISGLLLMKSIISIDQKTLSKVFFVLMLILLLACFLEFIGVLRGISDDFRQVVYEGGHGYNIYSGSSRDLRLSGHIRPKVFTSEPSLVAIGFYIFSSSWLILASSIKHWVWFLLINAVMIYFVASPILFISSLTSLIIMESEYRQVKNKLILHTAIIMVVVISVLPIILFLFPEIIDGLIFKRVLHIFNDSSYYVITSENLRMVFPFITMIDVLSVLPFFGTGIGGKELVLDYTSLPFSEVSSVIGNNNLANLFIYLGVVGAFMFIGAFYRYLKRYLGYMSLFSLTLLIVVLMQAMGGFVSPRFWCYVFILIAVFRVSSFENKGKRKSLNETKV